MLYAQTRAQLMKWVEQADGVSLTFDTWSSIQSKGYLGTQAMPPSAVQHPVELE
jgi:hypothetical protein